MGFDQEKFQSVTAILKTVYKNQNSEGGIHRNVLKKQLLASGKITSKTKVTPLIEGLIALDKLQINKEMISLNPSILQVGLLQKENDGYYIVMPHSKTHFPVSRSVAAGYKAGDILDVIVEFYNEKPMVVILGKSQKEFVKHLNSGKPQTRNLNPSPDIKVEKENCLLGRVVKLSHDDLVFIPNRKNLPIRHIPILNNKDEFASLQDKICVMNLVNPEAPLLGGHIISIKGDAGNPIHEYDAIAENYGAIMNWSEPNLQAEIAQIPNAVNTEELSLISEE